MMIGTWESLKNKEFFRLIGNVAFIAPTFLFGIYYFFVYLISKGNYIWISLTLILLFVNSSINFSTWHLGIFLLGPAVSSVSGLVFFFYNICLFVIDSVFQKDFEFRNYSPNL